MSMQVRLDKMAEMAGSVFLIILALGFAVMLATGCYFLISVVPIALDKHRARAELAYEQAAAMRALHETLGSEGLAEEVVQAIIDSAREEQ